MFGLSRLIAFAIVFCMGFGLATGLFVGIPAAVVASYSLRDLENTNLVNIPDEKFLSPDAEVDILDLNGIELYNEIKELQTFGDDLTLNLLKSRYGIIFHQKLELMMTDEAMNMPLKQLFSMEGVNAVLSNVFIGTVEKYECMNSDGTPGGDPNDPASYWVTPDGIRISALEELIADFSLNDFVTGKINTNNILHGDITLADILGYHYNEENDTWYDGSNSEVTGLMAVFADCTLDTVDDKINTAKIGELLGYSERDGKWYQDNGDGTEKEVTGLMAVVSARNIGNLGNLYGDLTVGDIVPEEQRTGIFSILSADTHLDNIAGAINDSIMGSPLQFFINENLISFADAATILDKMSTYFDDPVGTNPGMGGATMDLIYWNAYNTKNLYTYILKVEEGQPGYEKFLDYKSYYEFEVITDGSGNKTYVPLWEEVTVGGFTCYKIPTWRTKSLNASFGYIITLLSCNAEATDPTPIVTINSEE